MKFRAIVANDKPDLDGDRLSAQCLEQFAQTECHQVPVNLEFNKEQHLGYASNFRVVENELVCSGELTELTELPEGLVPVVGFTYEGTTENGEYIKPKLMSIGLTMNPATIGTKIEKID